MVKYRFRLHNGEYYLKLNAGTTLNKSEAFLYTKNIIKDIMLAGEYDPKWGSKAAGKWEIVYKGEL